MFVNTQKDETRLSFLRYSSRKAAMSTRYRGKFMKLSERRRRKSCSAHLQAYHASQTLSNKTITDESAQNDCNEPDEAMSNHDSYNSDEHISDTYDTSASTAKLLAENTGEFHPANGPDIKEDSDSGDSIPEKITWRDGRRIVELDRLAEQMKSCWDCGQPLHLHNIQTETRMGFGSILYVDCDCGVLNAVSTNKFHCSKESPRGRRAFDVNTKAALGMLHSGIAFNQMSNFMSTLEIQGLHHKSMKKRECEVSRHIQSVAEDSCSQALEAEVAAIREKSTTEPPDSVQGGPERVKGEFKYDMGWQKRGSGRCYDSKSGVGTMFGNNTGKICAYGVRMKDCRTCQLHLNKGQTPPAHECHKNWTGSSKAMEPDVGGELVKSIEKQGVDVSVIIMDDDTTTMARIRQELNHDIVKWSDINHTTKHLGNSLYALQKKHKALSTIVIKWLQKCFNYALAQNKGNATGCRQALLQIVPHAFGDHENCAESWCGFLKNPHTYKHSSLPYGKDLTGEAFRNDLESIFQVFATNAEKIAPGGSTKDVESFNNMVAAKAPKRCHYSSSGSLKNRVGCAVAQKNFGNGHVNKVNQAIGVSPGRLYALHALRKDTERKRYRKYQGSVENKRRRLQLKFNSKSENKTKEIREGTTYQSGVANTSISDITEIPPPQLPPVPNVVPDSEIFNKIFCDIETSSLHREADILQISAVFGQENYNQYITPTRSIAPAASAVTGLTANGGILFYNGAQVNTLPLQASLQELLAWLDNKKPVMLVGHNFKSFDFPRLIGAFKRCNLIGPLKECVLGISDTLLIFRELFPDMENHKQETLVSTFLSKSYEAHNALADVQSLQELCQLKIDNDSLFSAHSITVQSGISKLDYESKCAENVSSFQILLGQKVISKAMSQKLGQSGLCMGHLHLAYTRGGLEGLTQLLTEKVNGKVRVTATKRIITNLATYLEENKS